MSNNAKTKSFEENLAQLEALVKQLENGELGLDASIDVFEQGLHLVKACQTKLDEAKIRIEKISADGEE